MKRIFPTIILLLIGFFLHIPTATYAQTTSSVTAIPADTLFTDEVELITSENINKISIPGLSFSEPQIVDVPEEGKRYLLIPFFGEYIAAIYQYGIIVISIIGVIVIIRAGLVMTLSGGDAQQITHAKELIGKAILGIGLAVGSYTILHMVNPKLVQFDGLTVPYIEETALEDILGSSHLDIYPAPLGPGNCDDYNDAFQKYAVCMDSDWKALKAIARVESGCNPKARNSIGFVGMGQTKPEYCKSIFINRGYKEFAYLCTEENLLTPNMGIAVIALLQKRSAQLIKKHCSSADPSMQGAAFHAYNNVPAAALRFIKGGCDDPEDFIGYFHENMPKASGYLATKPYQKKYGHLLPNKTAYLRAIGEAKIKYALEKAGPTFAAFGGNIANPTPSGICPLDTDDPI